MRPHTRGSLLIGSRRAPAHSARNPVWPFVAVPLVVAMAAIGTLHAGDRPQGTPQTYRRNPFEHSADLAPKFETAVELVRLDSCDTPRIATLRPAGLNDTEKAAQEDLWRYHAMLAAYGEGNAAASVKPLLEMGTQKLTRMLSFANRRGIDPRAPWEPRLYALAVMLHTDAGLHIAEARSGEDIYLQFQAAADLLHLGVRCVPEAIKPLEPRWYVTLSRYWRDRYALAVSAALLDLARSRLTDDAAILEEGGLPR